MPKIRITMRRNFGCVGNSKNIVSPTENCDAVIAKIKRVFSSYEKLMSVEDKKRLLDMLSQIEKSERRISPALKDKMHEDIGAMWNKYRILEKQNRIRSVRNNSKQK